MAYKVLIPQDIAQEGKDFLLARGYEIKMGSGIGEADIIRDVADCEAILARTALFPAGVFNAGKKLKVIARHGVGVDNIDVKRATELGVWVTYAPESNALTVSEYVIGAIVALARNFNRLDGELRAGNWELRNKIIGSDLAGKVLGILGLGKIGRLVARKAALGLDMEVIAYDPYVSKENYGDHARPSQSLDEVMRVSDFVTLHLPGTAATKGVVGKRELSLMKKTAFLINAARGEVVVEEELASALKDGIIAGAALDVFDPEPPGRDNPLFDLGNVLLSPHNAALTKECMIRMALHAAQGIDEVLTGRRPAWPVNEPERSR